MGGGGEPVAQQYAFVKEHGVDLSLSSFLVVLLPTVREGREK